MRVYAISALLLSALVACRPYEESFFQQESTTTIMATPASAPTSVAPAVTSVVRQESVELRQVPDVAPVGELPDRLPPVAATTLLPVAPAPQQPAIPDPVRTALANPTTAPASLLVSSISPALSAATTTLLDAIAPEAPPATVTIAPFSNVPFVTVVWEETFLGTYSTWVPYTISLDFKPSKIHAPLPGKGGIGMGTLTGETGHTQTVVIGAAPTQGAVWVRGVAAAVGVGIAGIVI